VDTGIVNLGERVTDILDERGILAIRWKQMKEYIPEAFTFFWRKESPFSQHHMCNFYIEEKLYNCSEQWMMEQKALLFDDKETAAKIMQLEYPAAMKRLGRRIQNFDQVVWDEHSYNIVHQGNTHKFLQNITFLNALKNTKGTTLVAGSPHDNIWGIACYATEPAAQRRETWRGSNLLEEILTEIREEFLFMENLDQDEVNLMDSENCQILTIGLSWGPETEFGTLQRKCPEARNFIQFLENGILPTDSK